ncbi:MAG: MMPL family transporter, partial [Myxococcota bacterium]
MNVDSVLSGPLTRWVRLVRMRPFATIVLCAAMTAAALGVAATRLGINSNTIELFPEDLPARKNHDAFVELFPDLENVLLIVIDADTPEAARAAAKRLVATLSADRKNFEDVYLPGGGPFFEHNALLYRSVDDLYRFSDHLVRIQPIIGELERDGSIGNLAMLIQRGLDQVEQNGVDDEIWSVIAERLSDATVAIYEEHPLAISWEDLMLEGSAIEVVTRRIVLAHPVLDFGDTLPARSPLAAIRSAARALGPEGGVRVRVTGNPALTHEETLSLIWDIGVSGLFCLLLVSGLLTVAMRSRPLVVGVVATLLTGLTWTAGFAAIAVGDLNVISVAAGVLFLGLGVDFGIHLGMRYADLLRSGRPHDEALEEATASVGGSLVLCTATTATGFFAFLPTDYQGVAELGLITGVGLIIILFLTLTLFPALVTAVIHVDPAGLRSHNLDFGEGPGRWVDRHARWVRRGSLVAGVAGLALVSGLRFDPNIVAMRDPSTESVQAFNDLLADAGPSSPWYANSVAESIEAADALKLEMRALEVVDRSISITDYVPEEQEEKVEILADLSMLLDSGGGAPSDPQAGLPVAEQIESLRRLHDLLAENTPSAKSTALRESMHDLQAKLGRFLARIDADDDPGEALSRLDEVLLSSLPQQIARLKHSIGATMLTFDDLPPRLVRRLAAPDGRARVQTFPRENLEDQAAFERFVDAVQRVDPKVTGVAVNLVEFARTTQEAFRQAMATAVLVIAAMLWILWRR